jgi:agmatinase
VAGPVILAALCNQTGRGDDVMTESKTGEFRGNRNLKRLRRISQSKQDEEIQRSLELGLEAAESINDRSISLFSRGHQPAFAGINTFMKMPYCEDVRKVGDYEAAFVGVPFDTGTTYRPGTRFGPQAVRRISAVYDGYSVDGGVDIFEELDICDAGDVFVIPGNIEKSFDQVSKAISHIYTSGAFPIICGGDHSLGYPNVRGIAPHIDGNVGIIHFDRHIDMQDMDMDERMHTTPWFWTSNNHESVELHGSHRAHSHMHDVGLSNCPPKNLVQIGIGGWYGSRPGSQVANERGSSVMTMKDVEELGVQKAAEMALELAWKDAKAVYLSFDIDSIDPGFAPGTGTPEPGGFTPREALEMVRLIAREGLCGMEVVEVSPPYDVNDNTSQLACRVMLDALGTMVVERKIGHRDRVMSADD